MNTKHIIPLAALLASALSTQAGVVAITTVTSTAPVGGQTGISDLTAGGVVYDDLTIASATPEVGRTTGGVEHNSGFGAKDYATMTTLLSDDFITTGQLNSNIDMAFGTTINSGDSDLIFIFERGRSIDSDFATINPFVGGVVDTNWSLTINQSDFGDSGVDFTITGSDTQDVLGTTFTIADFTGGSGTLTNVTGIRISGAAGSLDTTMAGVAVPEPSTFAFLAGVLTLGFVVMRRRLS